MVHFGLICPSSTGHLHTMLPLGQELKRRGHRVTLVGVPKTQPKTLVAGLEFRAVGESYSPQSATRYFNFLFQEGKHKVLKLLLDTITGTASRSETYQKMYLTDAPEVIKTAGIEALLIDPSSSAGETVAEYLNLPFISICSGLVPNQEITVPPLNTVWNYNPSWWGILRNRVGYALLSQSEKPVQRVINFYRQQWNLPLLNSPDSLPKLLGNPLVVGNAPQLELLQKAALTITHAGMNTTLESLAN